MVSIKENMELFPFCCFSWRRRHRTKWLCPFPLHGLWHKDAHLSFVQYEVKHCLAKKSTLSWWDHISLLNNKNNNNKTSALASTVPEQICRSLTLTASHHHLFFNLRVVTHMRSTGVQMESPEMSLRNVLIKYVKKNWRGTEVHRMEENTT